MDERLSNQEEQQLKENDIFSEWLGESRFTARLIADIDDALSILATKRTTLEEKIINCELHKLAAQYCAILTAIHTKLADGKVPPDKALETIRTFNFTVHEAVESLLKALRYNLNYVEQYFEFAYATRLTNEWRFAVEAADIAKAIAVSND
jgi:hypothetical protein